MARLKKDASQQRNELAIAYFVANPTHTVEQFNSALGSGALTEGKKQPKMNLKTCYALRQEARHRLAQQSHRDIKTRADTLAALSTPASGTGEIRNDGTLKLGRRDETTLKVG